MNVYSWKEMNLAVTDLLNSIPKGTTSKDIIWIDLLNLCIIGMKLLF